jgi:hypothetical protein
MLKAITQFGGILPIITDPLLLPEGKSQVAKNCRFDHGGADALLQDLFNSTPTNAGPLVSLFLYQFAQKFLAWNSNVTAVTAPLANDSFNRVYYTEGGQLKVTDSTLYDQGGTNYPMAWLDPSPPTPGAALTATEHGIPPTAFLLITEVNLIGTTVRVTKEGYSAGFDDLSYINPKTPIMIYGTGIPALDNQYFNFTNVVSTSWQQTIDLVALSTATAITSLMTGPITAISLANPGVVTSAGHNLHSGDSVLFAISDGMPQLNGLTATVTVINAAIFSIGINTSGYTAFTAGTWSLTGMLSSNFGGGGGTAITSISNASPANVNITAHGLSTGTTIYITTTEGMSQFNQSQTIRITVVDANNFTLDNIDTTAWGTFVAGVYNIQPSFSLDEDPTQMISVYYVETFVDSYGSEGPPCPVDTINDIISIYDGDTVTVASTNTASSAQYGIVSKNVYRSNLDASGNEQLQLLPSVLIGGVSTNMPIPLATAAYSDNNLSAALEILMPSSDWDGPPSGIEGLVALANQLLCAFSGNLFLLSVPGFFHAWPASYQQPTDTPIMGIGAFGTSAIVLTQGIPYIVTANDPANVVIDKMGAGYGCVSKRSVVQFGGPVFYAGADGLVAMSPSGPQILTEKLISPEKWRSIYNPSSISGYFWENHYVGFYTNGGTQAGFIINHSTGDWIDLDFYATAGYHDEVSGNLYLVVNGSIVAFARGAAARNMVLTGKRYRFHLTTYSWIKVLAPPGGYPVNFTITYYNQDGTTTVFNLTANDAKPFKHPRMNLSDQCDVTITDGVTAIFLAGAIEELPE